MIEALVTLILDKIDVHSYLPEMEKTPQTPARTPYVSKHLLKKAGRRLAGFLAIAALLYFSPYLVIFFLITGALDVARHKNITPFLLKRYFLGNGILTMLMSPFNLLLDLVSDKNKLIFQLEDFPVTHQKEIKEVMAFFEAKKEEMIAEVDARMVNKNRGMVFLKWYDRTIDQSIIDFDLDLKFIKTVAISVFNKNQKTKLHFGPFSVTYRVLYNLTPIDSDEVFIEPDGKRHYWRDNPLYIFDDTQMHMSVNNTEHLRYCVFVDIIRPSPFPGLLNFISTVFGTLLNKSKAIFYKNWDPIA